MNCPFCRSRLVYERHLSVPKVHMRIFSCVRCRRVLKFLDKPDAKDFGVKDWKLTFLYMLPKREPGVFKKPPQDPLTGRFLAPPRVHQEKPRRGDGQSRNIRLSHHDGDLQQNG